MLEPSSSTERSEGSASSIFRSRSRSPASVELLLLTGTRVMRGALLVRGIVQGDPSGTVVGALPPDLATCPDCWREMATPGDRRYGYPFTSCSRCGPRYSIALGLPYDRHRTT